ncbi:MAG: hypothetical protein ACTSRS_12975 [Candidatus Helarchaeota archaeon]
MLERLKTSPSKSHLLLLTIVALILFVILTILFQLDNAIVSASSPYGILHFEFAFNKLTAQTILTNWGPALQALILRDVYLDFLYIVGYSLALFGANVLITRTITERWYNFGTFCALSAILAGIFDVAENINLIVMLTDPTNFPAYIPTIASICAAIKFGLLLLSLGFFLLLAFFLLIKKLRSHDS